MFVVEKVKVGLVQPLKAMTRQQQLACVVIGVLGGLFPIPGITTGVTVALGVLLKLNAAQTAVSCFINLLLTAVEIVMIPVFAQVGVMIFGFLTRADGGQFTAANLKRLMSTSSGLVGLATAASSMFFHAILAWAVVSGAAVGLLYQQRLERERRMSKIGR